MKLFIAFCKQQFYVLTAYRVSFWMTIVNTFVRIFALSMLWTALYAQNPTVMRVSLNQMLIYSTASVALSQTFTWWDGPHRYVAASVRNGKIILDMFRPVDFEELLFHRGASEALLNFIIYTVPVFISASLFLGIKVFSHIQGVLLSLVAMLLGYLLLFTLNYFLALISFITLNLNGILHTYHGIVAFCSGQIVPLWLFPNVVRNVLNFLPFRGVFYIPLSIMIGDISGGDVFYSFLFQAIWIVALFVLGRLLWFCIQKRVVIQGG